MIAGAVAFYAWRNVIKNEHQRVVLGYVLPGASEGVLRGGCCETLVHGS